MSYEFLQYIYEWIDVLPYFYYFVSDPHKLQVLYFHIMSWKG